MDAHKEVFTDGLGTVKDVMAAIHVDPTVTPQFYKALASTIHPQKVEQELEHLQSHGVIEPVVFLDWAAPIVPVVKGRDCRPLW